MTLLELIEQYRVNHLLRLDEASDDLAEIERRLSLIKDFKSTEAVRINMILDCGSDAGWRS